MLFIWQLSLAVYWGAGWESLELQKIVYRGLPVRVDDASISTDSLNDEFNWESYESSGVSSVAGSVGYEAESLQSWESKVDAVRHGYFMAYQMHGGVTALNKEMEDYFFSVTLDVGHHSDYAARGVTPNCTLRFSLFDSMPADFAVEGSSLELNPAPMNAAYR